jgi:hypothetical protein
MLPDPELEQPTAIARMISQRQSSPALADCGGGEFATCVGVDDFENVEVIARRGDEIIMRWMLLAPEGVFLFEVAPDCMEFRRRAPTGKRSAVVAVCGPELAARPFRPSDLDNDGFRCRDGKFGDDAESSTSGASGASGAAGCSVSDGIRGWASIPFVAILFLLALRRRHKPAIGD